VISEPQENDESQESNDATSEALRSVFDRIQGDWQGTAKDESSWHDDDCSKSTKSWYKFSILSFDAANKTIVGEYVFKTESHAYGGIIDRFGNFKECTITYNNIQLKNVELEQSYRFFIKQVSYDVLPLEFEFLTCKGTPCDSSTPSGGAKLIVRDTMLQYTRESTTTDLTRTNSQ
jgi:hypothetical protein